MRSRHPAKESMSLFAPGIFVVAADQQQHRASEVSQPVKYSKAEGRNKRKGNLVA